MGYFHRLFSPENLRRLAWLAFLGPFFFLTYNFANRFAASHEPGVPSIQFAWERHVPFLAWTILPYWSSDFLYAASFLTCRTKADIDRLGLRLVAIQVVSVVCFSLFPLRLLLQRPPIDGFFGALFQALGSFDLPYNQAPSLHVSLAYILWRQFRGPFWGAWFLLVGLSTMTTFQHQFIDLPTGLWAGVLVVALTPVRSRPECARPRLAAYYGIGSAILTVLAFRFWWWILLWPAFSLSLVAAAYWTGNVETLGKRGGSPPFRMWPYTLFAWINSRLWNSGTSEVAGGVWVGRPDTEGFWSVVDLTGELPLRADRHVPMLDLAVPSGEQLSAAVAAIDSLSDRRPTLVCCALGYSRSAASVAAWLVSSGRSSSMEEAIKTVRNARPKVVLSPTMIERLTQWAGTRYESTR
jgi:hypothetical protein